jgi:hypothetical protein
MFDLEATYVCLKELIKNARTFMFSRISFDIFGAFSAWIKSNIVKNVQKTILKRLKNDKMIKLRAYCRKGT